MKRNKRLHIFRYLYFSACFFLFMTRPVHAYIDPSVMTYAIQAISGIAIALGTVFSLVYRKIRRKMNLQEQEKTIRETDNFQYTDPDTGETVYALSDRKGVSTDLFVKTASEENRKEWRLKDRIADVIPPAFLLALTFGMFFPSTLFLGNIDEFVIDYNMVFPILLGVTSTAFVALCAFTSVFPKKIYLILSTLLAAAAIGFFIQSAFLNPPFAPFNGQKVIWSDYTRSTVLSTAVWLALIAGTVWLVLNYEKKVPHIRNMICLLLAAVEVVSLIVIGATTDRSVLRNGIVTKKDEFIVSKNQNTIVFVLDTLDGEWIDQFVMTEPENQEALKDFTFFSDVVSEGAPTIVGMPTMFTGVVFDPRRETLNEYYDRAFEESSMLEDIADAGWKVKLYTDLSYFNRGDITKVDNVVASHNAEYVIRDNLRFAREMYRFVSFNTMPMLLKRFYWTGTNAINREITTLTQDGVYSTEEDAVFYQDMSKAGVHASDETNDFILYHLFGAHGPFFMDENAEPMPETNEIEGLIRQIHGSMKIVREYLQMLKDTGAYDKTTFIITADHGGQGVYQNPAVLIKMPNVDQNAMVTDSRPLTFGNLYATYAKSVLPGHDEYGETMFECKGIEGPRYHTADNVLGRNYFDEKLLDESGYTMYEVNGPARGLENVTILDH